jgi:hypothetical protein
MTTTMLVHRIIIGFIFTTLALWAAATGTSGQELTFTASVNFTRVGIDDQLVLTVSVSGSDIGGISEPELPFLDGFEIVGTNTSSSSQFRFVNGKMTSSKTMDYIYTLQPLEVGRATIGSASIKFKGKSYKTEPIEIEVVTGSSSGKTGSMPSPGIQAPSAPSPSEVQGSDDLFLRADFDRQEAFLGQQVTATYILYNRTSLTNVQFGQVPTFTGFWAEKIYDADRLNFQQQVIGGKRYQVAVLKKLALFPTAAGEIKVEPMELICDLRVQSRDFFDSFWGRTKRVRVASKPITITVKPLPQAGKPDGFSGPVGQFVLKARVDHGQVKAGEPVELTLEIRGQGNLKTVSPPELPALEGFTAFEPEVREELSSSGDKIGGAKTYRYVLIPKEQGEYLIEALNLHYFDPAEKAYRTASTKPIAIKVQPSERGDLPLVVGLGRDEIKVVGKDIRYIKSGTVILKDQSGDLYQNRVFQGLQIVPLMAIFAAAAVRRRRDRISRDVGYARWHKAHRQARHDLRATQKSMRSQSATRFYGAMAKILTDYLGNKLNISVGGITSQQLQEELNTAQVDNQLVHEVLECLHVCDYSRFAPASSQLMEREAMLKRVRDLIGQLEKAGL